MSLIVPVAMRATIPDEGRLGIRMPITGPSRHKAKPRDKNGFLVKSYTHDDPKPAVNDYAAGGYPVYATGGYISEGGSRLGANRVVNGNMQQVSRLDKTVLKYAKEAVLGTTPGQEGYIPLRRGKDGISVGCVVSASTTNLKTPTPEEMKALVGEGSDLSKLVSTGLSEKTSTALLDAADKHSEDAVKRLNQTTPVEAKPQNGISYPTHRFMGTVHGERDHAPYDVFFNQDMLDVVMVGPRQNADHVHLQKCMQAGVGATIAHQAVALIKAWAEHSDAQDYRREYDFPHMPSIFKPLGLFWQEVDGKFYEWSLYSGSVSNHFHAISKVYGESAAVMTAHIGASYPDGTLFHEASIRWARQGVKDGAPAKATKFALGGRLGEVPLKVVKPGMLTNMPPLHEGLDFEVVSDTLGCGLPGTPMIRTTVTTWAAGAKLPIQHGEEGYSYEVSQRFSGLMELIETRYVK